ncbi:hypothetical protein DL98DRAFT_617987 [Cadophora sp. DSE1049]|nr:hypothetical protein DL98DRAFT_617987 [Cadophora sp. DSE1049]
MSATEADLVVGLISSIIAVLGTIAKVYAAAKDAEDVPTTFREIAQQLPFFRDTLQIVEERINTRRPDDESSRSIKPALAGCKDKALRLEIMFRKVVHVQIMLHDSVKLANISRFEHRRLAADTLGKGNPVGSLMNGMLEDVKQLAENHIVKAAAEADIGKLVKAIEELSAMPPSLSEDASGKSINNYGPGTQNVNAGEGTQNNNTGKGRQFIGQNQYFGKDDYHPPNVTVINMNLPWLIHYRRCPGPC